MMKRIFLALLLAAAACDDSSAVKEGAPTPATPKNDAGGTSDGGPDCFENPKTHFEIINACTAAQKVAKSPTLHKLLSDGGLPPLD